MKSYFAFAAKTPVILFSFIAAMAIGVGFSLLRDAMGGAQILDMTADPEAAKTQLAAMSEEVKRKHFIGTLTLDLAYPLSLLTLLAGLTFRFAPQAIATPLSFVPVAAAFTDYVENTTILLILRGNESLIEFKSLMTLIKFPLFAVAGIIALICILYGIAKRFFSRQ